MLAQLAVQGHVWAVPAPAGDRGSIAKGPTKVGHTCSGVLDNDPVEVFDVVSVAAANRKQVVGPIPALEIADRARRALKGR